MLRPLQSVTWDSCFSSYFCMPAFSPISPSEIMNTVKDVAQTIFLKLRDFFKKNNNQNKEINLKAIAMVSCLSLIALLVISILRCRDGRLIPPPTPQRGN